MNAFIQINRIIRAYNCKLRQGNGYLYITYDDGTRFESHSIYWNDLRDASAEDIAHVIGEAQQLVDRVLRLPSAQPQSEKPMTLAELRSALRALRMTLKINDGELCVNLDGGREATAYYTDDRSEALATARDMRRRADAKAAKQASKTARVFTSDDAAKTAALINNAK